MFGIFKKKLKSTIEKISKKVSEARISEEVEEKKLEKVKVEEEKVAKPGVVRKIKKAVAEKELTEPFLGEVLADLENTLLENNVAAEAAEKIVSDVKKRLAGKSVKRAQAEGIIRQTLSSSVEEILNQPAVDVLEIIKKAQQEKRPAVILFLGFNGTGKSLSVAKTALWLKQQGFKPLLAAGDTFRAAGIEQLEEYAAGVDVPAIKSAQGADSCAVIFDAVKAAASRKYDVVLADTAGRAHTDRNLIEELKKIIRVNKPDLKLLVCEAVAGSDVVNQARIFNEAAADFSGIDGFVLTKWDVDEKGGAALSLCYALKKPIVFLGTGQGYSALEKFDLKKTIKNIFA